MMRPKTLNFAPITPSANGICLSQTPGAAGNLVLNGALASGGAVAFANASQGIATQGIHAYFIDITSAANDSARAFTITGTDPDGKAQTEARAGPNTGTVTSVKYWRSISSIAIDAASAGALTLGINSVGQFVSQTVSLDLYEPQTTVAMDISGTINYDVQKAFERPTAGETPNWVAGGLATQTTDANTAYSSSTGAVRLKVNSYSAGATAKLQVLQSALTV